MKRSSFTIDNPKLAAEWDYEKNADLRPEDFTSAADRFVWWKCAWGHCWQDRISNRVKGSGCPYDKAQRMLGSFNVIATERPDIAAEWDIAKNDFLSPEDVDVKSTFKAWWRCANGHSWKARVADRLKGNGCPECGDDGN